MEDQFTYYDKIDQYLTNSMSSTELADFENELASDMELREEVSIQKDLRDVVIITGLSDVRSLMDTDLNQKPTKRKYNKGLLGSIGIALITSVGLVLYNTNNADTHTSEKETKTVEINNKQVLSDTKKEEDSFEKTNTPLPSNNQKKENITASTPTVIEVLEDTTSSAKPLLVIDKKENEPTVSPLAKKDEQVSKIIEEQPSIPKILPLAFKGDIKTVEEEYERGNGQIIIEGNVSGGVPPYSYFIFENELQQGKLFTNLEAGTYLVKAVDANNTSIEIGSAKIIESNCLTDYNQSFIPAYDEYWPIPSIQSSSFIFKVFSLRGLEFEKIYELGEETVWFGLSSNEEKLGIGYYRFEINYENGETCYGELTIGN